jgi:hypothetical protein
MGENKDVHWWMGVDTETVSDRGSSNVVLAVTIFLILAGIGLSIVTWWFWRNTHPDPEALAPLDVMSARDFRDRGPIEQRRLLDAARPSAVAVDEMEAPIELTEEPLEPVSFEELVVFEDEDDLVDFDEPMRVPDEEPRRGASPIDPLLGG